MSPIHRRAVLRGLAATVLTACAGGARRSADTTGTDAAPAATGRGTHAASPVPRPDATAGPVEPSIDHTPSDDPTAAAASPAPAASSEPPESTTSPTVAPSETEPVDEPTSEPASADPTQTSTTRPTIEEICRQSLGLPEPRPDDRRHTIAGLMLHHTAAPSSTAAEAPARLRSHSRYHRDQGWPDIAYHVGVDVGGNVYELRDPALPGDTFTNYDPSGWFLVVAEGDFNASTPSPELLETLARVFAWASTMHGAPVDTLAGHRDHASTSCPGDQLYGALTSIRDRAKQILAQGGVERTRVCGDQGDQRVAAIEAGG